MEMDSIAALSFSGIVLPKLRTNEASVGPEKVRFVKSIDIGSYDSSLLCEMFGKC